METDTADRWCMTLLTPSRTRPDAERSMGGQLGGMEMRLEERSFVDTGSKGRQRAGSSEEEGEEKEIQTAEEDDELEVEKRAGSRTDTVVESVWEVEADEDEDETTSADEEDCDDEQERMGASSGADNEAEAEEEVEAGEKGAGAETLPGIVTVTECVAEDEETVEAAVELESALAETAGVGAATDRARFLSATCNRKCNCLLRERETSSWYLVQCTKSCSELISWRVPLGSS